MPDTRYQMPDIGIGFRYRNRYRKNRQWRREFSECRTAGVGFAVQLHQLGVQIQPHLETLKVAAQLAL